LEKHTVATPTFGIGAFAVIFDDQGRVLLCHRTDMDAWNLPGGTVELGETPWDGAIREVREEVGLEVEIERLVGVYAKPSRDEVVFTFTCRVTGGALTLSDEAREIAYFAFDEIPRNTLPKHVERIKDALKAQPQALFAVQDSAPLADFVAMGVTS
jgi:8-oxo-dGTP diphosphatase